MPAWRSLLPALLLVLLACLHPRSCVQAQDARPAGRIVVPKRLIAADDGDSLAIHWKEGTEQVRLLGIDTPEVMHLEHDLPYTQPFGEQAAGFLAGCLAMAQRVELLRSGEQDPYGRTLGYLLLDGANYSVRVIQARLAIENVSHFGDSGLVTPAKEVLAAAKAAGPVAFEEPYLYRARMRKLSAWLKREGLYPQGPRPPAPSSAPR